MNESVTAELSYRPGEALRLKMLTQVKSRCHAILLDQGEKQWLWLGFLKRNVQPWFHSDLNSKFGIGINVFQIMLLSAIKFYTHVSMLPPKQRAASNPPFFLKIIDSCLNYLFALASAKCASKVQTCFLHHISYKYLLLFIRVDCHLAARW
jgi:hypothetical protein